MKIEIPTGFGLCACAIAIHNYIYYFDIYAKINNKKDDYIDPVEIFAVAIYFLGACIGSITCGVYKYTWPARRCNVSESAESIDGPPISTRIVLFSYSTYVA